MDSIIVALIIIVILAIPILMQLYNKFYESPSTIGFHEKMKHTDIYLELIKKIDKTNFELEEMIDYIRVYERSIELQYFNPKPNGYCHHYKVEIADDKSDMSMHHRKVLLEIVANYCIENTNIYNYFELNNELYDNCIGMKIESSIKQKYINSYKTPIC